MGEIPQECRDAGEGCSYAWQTDTLGSRTKENRSCTKGAMGTGEGREEDGLEGHFTRDSGDISAPARRKIPNDQTNGSSN
jgi:hypothetical protein